MENEIIVYQAGADDVKLEVRVEEETVWLTQAQIAELFGTKRTAITKHLGNIYKSGELEEKSTCSILEHMGNDGKQIYRTKYYNLDAILSVGYRVNSYNATQFRRWANEVLKDYLLKGQAINQRLNLLEDKLDRRLTEHAQVLEEHQKKIDFILKTELKPTQGIFFQGQIFDAYAFFENIILEAKNEIVLIDNYVDLSVLERFAKKKSGVKITIFTNPKTAITALDLEKFNAQYGGLELRHTEAVHDRFIILDGEAVFHLGASLKDLGKKCFAFSRMDKRWAGELMEKLSSETQTQAQIEQSRR